MRPYPIASFSTSAEGPRKIVIGRLGHGSLASVAHSTELCSARLEQSTLLSKICEESGNIVSLVPKDSF